MVHCYNYSREVLLLMNCCLSRQIAIAPIVFADSIDMSKAWMQSRYDKGETDEERTASLNCAMISAPNGTR